MLGEIAGVRTRQSKSKKGELKRKIDSLGEIFTKITAIITKTT